MPSGQVSQKTKAIKIKFFAAMRLRFAWNFHDPVQGRDTSSIDHNAKAGRQQLCCRAEA